VPVLIALAITFIEPMLLKPAAALPRGDQWHYELKFDGFRGLAVKDGRDVRLFSRNGRDLSKRFPRIVKAIESLKPKSATIDGEIVCLDEQGRPCFEDLQNFGPTLESRLFFYCFDLPALDSQDLCTNPIEDRKDKLQRILPSRGPLRLSEFVTCDPETLVTFARQNRLEGIVAKRNGSRYEVGKRSGAWQKFKTYQRAVFLVGGFLPCPGGIESLAIGFWRENAFRYAARVEVYLKGKPLHLLTEAIRKTRRGPCPFERVPLKKAGDTWSVGLVKEDAERFVWIEPSVEVSVRFTEWTRGGLLRHAGLIDVQI
jgi:bifunctional non-homologous end joining protein LigD